MFPGVSHEDNSLLVILYTIQDCLAEDFICDARIDWRDPMCQSDESEPALICGRTS